MAPTAKDLYTKRLLKLNKGTPLYCPGEVHIGDVGYIDPHDGFFQKLYNIANPPRNGKLGCPPPFKFETIRHPQKWDAIHMRKSKNIGGSIRATIPKGQMEFAFSEVRHSECILIPGSVVVIECIKKTGHLPKYMNDHLNWIGSTFVGDEGYHFSRKDVILVHRIAKTDRWAIAVNNSSEVVSNLSFKVDPAVGAAVWGQWSTDSLISHHGPVPGDGTSHPKGPEGANQTIFVRRIALRPSIRYFGKSTFKAYAHSGRSTLKRIRATIAREEREWWADKKPENTKGRLAAA